MVNISIRQTELNVLNQHQVTGIKLLNKYEDAIREVCIIQGPNQATAIDSVTKLGLNYKLFTSFNFLDNIKDVDTTGIQIKNVLVPEEYKNLSWLNHVRSMNHLLSYEETTRLLNHMVIWDYCISTGLPVLIIEHDVILNTKLLKHTPKNSIISLSSGIDFYVHNNNWMCMNGVNSYSVDQFSAKTLFNDILTNGIVNPLELMFRVDKFTIINARSVIQYSQ
jgi:GR25 family glycosyltransferase involved in LPS biosynthesis